MCDGIAIIVVKIGDEIKVYCDPENGSHDKLLSEHVPVEYHNSYIKIEYIFPGEFRLDCPDEECRTAAMATGMVEEAMKNVLRIKPSTAGIIGASMPVIVDWPRSLMQFANLWYADLSNANLRYANLRYADLRYADLRYANLSNANLRYANLSNADLSGADISDEQKKKYSERGAIA